MIEIINTIVEQYKDRKIDGDNIINVLIKIMVFVDNKNFTSPEKKDVVLDTLYKLLDTGICRNRRYIRKLLKDVIPSTIDIIISVNKNEYKLNKKRCF